MNDAQLREWLELLAPINCCPNDQHRDKVSSVRVCCRTAIVKELLQNANEDQMTQEDRRDCLRGLEMVNAGEVVNRVPARKLDIQPDLLDLEEVH